MDRDLCANCNHWREEHYNASGIFIGDRWFGCVEYLGSVPDPKRRAKKQSEIDAEQSRREGLIAGGEPVA